MLISLHLSSAFAAHTFFRQGEMLTSCKKVKEAQLKKKKTCLHFPHVISIRRHVWWMMATDCCCIICSDARVHAAGVWLMYYRCWREHVWLRREKEQNTKDPSSCRVKMFKFLLRVTHFKHVLHWNHWNKCAHKFGFPSLMAILAWVL